MDSNISNRNRCRCSSWNDVSISKRARLRLRRRLSRRQHRHRRRIRWLRLRRLWPRNQRRRFQFSPVVLSETRLARYVSLGLSPRAICATRQPLRLCSRSPFMASNGTLASLDRHSGYRDPERKPSQVRGLFCFIAKIRSPQNLIAAQFSPCEVWSS